MKISKNQLKEFSTLQQKKYRQRTGLFLVEGDKIVKEVLEADSCPFQLKAVIGLGNWLDQNNSYLKQKRVPIYEVTPKELARLSALKTPNQVVLILEQKRYALPQQLEGKLSLMLDHIQDPGNLGTIIRIADWFGIEHIFCSPDTVEFYNPKVIQATMGSFMRVQIHYGILTDFTQLYPAVPCYGALLDGENIFKTTLSSTAFIFIGNESRGLSLEVQKLIDYPITIARVGRAESLNAAVATGILCAAFRK